MANALLDNKAAMKAINCSVNDIQALYGVSGEFVVGILACHFAVKKLREKCGRVDIVFHDTQIVVLIRIDGNIHRYDGPDLPSALAAALTRKEGDGER